METAAHIRLIFGKATKAIEQVDRASISQTGLNVSDFSILEALMHKGPMPINIIGKKILLTSGSMTTAANRLERKGLVERIQDPSDGRCTYLHLTEVGLESIRNAYRNHIENLEKIVETLDEHERDELVRLLKKIGHHALQVEVR